MKKTRVAGGIFLGMIYLFLYLPMIVLIIYSFNSRGFPAAWESFTLAWYQQLGQASELWNAFGVSLLVATTSTVLSLILGLLFIFLIHHKNRYSRYTSIFYGNLIIPETVLALSLVTYFILLGIPMGLSTLICSHVLLGLGFVIPVLVVRSSEIDPRLLEASTVLGGSSLDTFLKVTLPLLRPTLLACGLLIFVISFDDYILAFFCSGSAAPTLSVYLASSIRYGISPIMGAFSSVILIFTIGMGALFFSLSHRTRIF